MKDREYTKCSNKVKITKANYYKPREDTMCPAYMYFVLLHVLFMPYFLIANTTTKVPAIIETRDLIAAQLTSIHPNLTWVHWTCHVALGGSIHQFWALGWIDLTKEKIRLEYD